MRFVKQGQSIDGVVDEITSRLILGLIASPIATCDTKTLVVSEQASS